MFHLIRFTAGVLTGIAVMKLIQSKSTKETLEKAQDKVRDATVSGLEAIENASAKARAKLEADEEESKAAPKKAASRKHSSKHEKTESDQESAS